MKASLALADTNHAAFASADLFVASVRFDDDAFGGVHETIMQCKYSHMCHG